MKNNNPGIIDKTMLLSTLSLVHTENICCDVMRYGPNEVRFVRHDVTVNIFHMDQTQG